LIKVNRKSVIKPKEKLIHDEFNITNKSKVRIHLKSVNPRGQVTLISSSRAPGFL